MNTEQIIGNPAKRFEELAYHEFEWNSFYNGWLEGRKSLLQELSEKPKRKKQTLFNPPTIEEIVEYCKERGNNIDAQYFYDYNTARDWKINGKTMKSWKSAIITFEKNERNNSNSNNTNTATIRNFNGKISASSILARKYKEQIEQAVSGNNSQSQT